MIEVEGIPLVSVLKHISEEPPATEEDAQWPRWMDPTPRTWHVSDRLSPTGVKTLVTSSLAGSTSRALAEQYGIGQTSVKRLLREHGAGKQRPKGAA